MTSLFVLNTNRFWNTIASIFVDLVLGFVAAGVLYYYSNELVEYLTGKGRDQSLYFIYRLAETFRAGVIWIMSGQPAGIKLNENLNQFIGTVCLYLMDSWEVMMSNALLPIVSYILKVLY